MHLPYVRAFTIVCLAETLVVGEPERALEIANAGLSVARTTGYLVQEAELLRVKAAALATTDLAEAEARVSEGMALARKLGMRPEEGHALRILGDIQLAKGEIAASHQSRDRAREIYAELGMKYWLLRIG